MFNATMHISHVAPSFGPVIASEGVYAPSLTNDIGEALAFGLIVGGIVAAFGD